MTLPSELLPHLQQMLDSAKGANPNRTSANATDEMEVLTVERVQAALRANGVELTYGEAFDLWENVNLDSQQSWVEAHSVEGVWIELERLCEHVRDGCDYAGISNPG